YALSTLPHRTANSYVTLSIYGPANPESLPVFAQLPALQDFQANIQAIREYPERFRLPAEVSKTLHPFAWEAARIHRMLARNIGDNALNEVRVRHSLSLAEHYLHALKLRLDSHLVTVHIPRRRRGM